MDLLLKSSAEQETSEDNIRPRILIAGDHEENRYILSHALVIAGFDCIQAATGIEALRLAQTMPDLIILDVRLPDISGYEVCQRIKKDPYTSSIPVLQISASFTSSEDRVRALDGGADGYLTHPVDRIVLVATVRSLLRLRTAEKIARESAENWKSTFDALAEGLALLDSDNRLLRWNNAFAEICGRKTRLKFGDDVATLFLQLVGSDEAFKDNGPRRNSADFTIDKRTVQLSVNRIGSDGAAGEKILILTDITDRKLAEYALRTAEKLAATGKLANAIAHEINNPLEALTNLIYLAQRVDSVAETRSLLARADGELARISRITRQSLSFHRDTQTPVEVDVGQLVADVVDLFGRLAERHGARLVCDRESVPVIQAFPGQLSQVFGNLIRNAAEATCPDTEVMVRVRAVHHGEHEGVRVTVCDRGRGIPKEIQRKMFDPFFTTKDLKGSGLGLWVSRSLVLRHGGTIHFRSSDRPGHNGTIFKVFLPADGSHPSDASQDQVAE